MATQIINADPRVLNTVSVDRAATVSQTLSTVAVGDLVRFSVRQNPGQGKGLIFVGKDLIQATLPEHLQPGDRLLAKVAGLDNQLLLRILDIQKTSRIPGGPSTRIAGQLQSYMGAPGAVGLQGLQPFALPEGLQELAANFGALRNLFATLGSTEQLLDSQLTFQQLLNATGGELASSLRESADALRSLLNTLVPPASQRLADALREVLASLIETNADGGQVTPRQLSQLIESLTKELRENKSLKAEEREVFREILRNLEDARGNPEQLKAQLEQVLARLQQPGSQKTSSQTQTDPLFATKLQQTAARLEQMAATQETLNQLNPLMQALGEPALVLFPFLFQGLISHSEVTLDTYTAGKKHKGKEKRSGGKKDREQDLYHRIQINVPLPSMGPVAVDIAYREKEILARFTVEQQERGAFLLEQLEHLAAKLREQGFERAELVAEVGEVDQKLPAWSTGLHSRTSFIA